MNKMREQKSKFLIISYLIFFQYSNTFEKSNLRSPDYERMKFNNKNLIIREDPKIGVYI